MSRVIDRSVELEAFKSDDGAKDRFWMKVEKTDECWLWTAAISTAGYGRFSYPAGTLHQAHRLSYFLENGFVSEGLDLDHLCRVRHCVRPSHLEPVTRRENLLRGVGLTAMKALQKSCIRGHPFKEHNIIHARNGTRKCRTCVYKDNEERRQRRRAKQ